MQQYHLGGVLVPMTGDLVVETVERALDAMPVALGPDTPLAVAFSGGLDSSVLLAALARSKLGFRVRALHVDHGLHACSRDWAGHCAGVAGANAMAFESVRVELDRSGGASLEARARDARYRALEQLMRPGEWLLTAHQSDDQLETLLLRLLRGAGARGMRGILELDRFGPGYRVRPLLACSRAELAAAAAEWGLDWIEDPSNADTAHDRNYLRAQVLPALAERWPQAAAAAVRHAASMRDAEDVLEGMARIDARPIDDLGSIERAHLRGLEPARQRNLLRYVLRRLGLPAPAARQLETLRASLEIDRADAGTRVAWPGAEARVYRDRLYLFAPLPAIDLPENARLGREPLSLAGAGTLSLVSGEPVGLPGQWIDDGLEIAFRVGGERFRPREGASRRTLKHFLQEAGIVPWMRDRIPLLRHGGEIVAIGDIWQVEVADSARPGGAWRVVWADHPRLR